MTRWLLFVLVLSPTFAFAQDKYFDSSGVRIRYVDQGSGQPVILIHGLSGDVERNWIDTGVLPSLAKNFRVIALDLRGHGKSDKPHEPSAYGIEIAKDVLRLMDHLKIQRAHMVGYSLGGHIVAKLLTTNPDRFLTASLGGSGGYRQTPPAQAIENLATEFEGQAPFRSIILQILPTTEPRPSEDTVLALAREFAGRNDVKAMAALVRGISELVASEAQLNAVQVPTLAIIGTADPLLADVNNLEKAWPALKVVRIDGGTHHNLIPPGRGTAARSEFVKAIRDFISASRQ